MRKLKLLLIFFFIASTHSFAQLQQIKIVSFTVKNQLPAKVDAWGSMPGALLLVAQKQPNAQVKGVRLVVQIKSNGAIVCGNNLSTGLAVDDNFTARTFSGSELTGLLGNCHDLKDGSYSICAQFFNIDRVAISNEVCKEFVVETPRDVDYAPPTLITPENGKIYTDKELQRPVTFRWTPIVPKPRETVTYRLRVWQLMQGQNGTAAMRSNQPIVSKDVDNLNQATVTNIITGPCKPPYLCDFIWSVQALDQDGKPIGRNEGSSEPWAFSMASQYIIGIDSLEIDCPVGTKYNFKVKVCNPNALIATFDKLELMIVNGAVLGVPLNITGTTPPIGSTIAANGCIWVTGSFNYATPFVQACVRAYISDQATGLKKAQDYICDSLYCACDPCKTMGVALKDDKLTTIDNTSSQILLSGVLTGLNANNIKKVTMELVYYDIVQTGDANCVKCAENAQWGNFIKPASAAFAGYGVGLLNGVSFGREWTWTSTIQKECGGTGGHTDGNGGVITGTGNTASKCATCGNNGANAASMQAQQMPGIGGIEMNVPLPVNPNAFTLPIAIPPGSSLKCCGDKIKICIRYTIWDFCCHACDFVKCYEIERKAK